MRISSTNVGISHTNFSGGEAIAAKFVEEGTKVVVTGRRQDRLAAIVNKHGSDKASGVVFDVTKLKEIPAFAKSIEDAHPDIDCLLVNSGIQRIFNFAKPETINLDILDEETTTNYTAYVHLTVAFLPSLLKKDKASLVYVSATLGLVPGMLRTPNYNAVKGALHNWIMVMREQLKRGGNDIKVVEVFPPAVQTELHDERHQADIKNGGQIGMPLPAFTEKFYEGLQKGDDQFGVGPAEELLAGWEAERTKLFLENVDRIDGLLKPYLR